MSPARHFIDERLAEVWEEVNADFQLWHSGKKHPGAEAGEALAEKFWGEGLDRHADAFAKAAFETAPRIEEEHKFDAVQTTRDAADAAVQAIQRLVMVMVRIDRSLRGKGSPDAVESRDPAAELERCRKRLGARTLAELAAAESRGRVSVLLPLGPERGIRWFLGNCHRGVFLRLVPPLLALLAAAFWAGFAMGRG